MARLNVNPTRMELQTLKTRLKTARRGHKLLKDKSDEMVRQFVVYCKQNKALRETVEEELAEALKAFITAHSRMHSQETEQALAMPSVAYNFTAGLTNIMGLNVPKIKITETKVTEILPYSLVSGNSRLDSAILTLSAVLNKIIELAEVEKICDMLAEDIEKNRRRVNALEFVVIPQIEETIKFIIMKLDENERNNRVRLMKVKEMLEEAE